MQHPEDSVVELYAEELPKLTKWENEPTVRNLKQDYTSARDAHGTQVAKINDWLDNLLVQGNAKVKKIKGRSTIVPKLIRKQAEWRYASLSEPFLSTEDLYKTEPQSWQDKKAAIQAGLILNDQLNTKINKVKFIDEYVRAAVNEGTVIVRIGWDYEEEEQDVEVPLVQQVPVQDPAQAQQMLEQGLPPVEEVQVGTEIQQQIVPTKNQPSVEVCNYKSVVVDPTCQGDAEKAQFIIYIFETSMSDLEKAGIYKNLDHINLEANSILNEPDDITTSGTSFNFTDKPRKRFVAYEYWGYWDIHDTGRTEPIVATYVGDTMIRLEENPFPDKKLPFVIVPYLPTKFSVYGEPDGELLEDNQKVIGAVTRGLVDMMGRSAAGQMGSRKDALDVTNRRKFEMGMDYEYNSNIDPRMAFFMHPYPEIPQSAQFMLQLQNMEAESLTGVKAFHGGLTGDDLGKTATGARGVLDAASKRELGIVRRLAEGLKQIGRKIIAMNVEFLSEEEVVKLTDEEFVTINRDELRGNYDVKLDISTAEADNAKAQELAFMLQTMGNTMPPDMSQMILADIARLRKMPELAKAIAEYKPEPDPLAEEAKQLQVALLKAQVENERAQAEERKAKARETSNKADMSDLDFVEQESGVKQERDLEKQGAQARANMDLKDREYALKNRNDFMKNLFNTATKSPNV